MPRIPERKMAVGKLAELNGTYHPWNILYDVLTDREVLGPLINQYGSILLIPEAQEQLKAMLENKTLLLKDTVNPLSEKALFVPLSNLEDIDSHFKRLLRLYNIPEYLFNPEHIGELGFLIEKVKEGWDIDIVCHQVHSKQARRISQRSLEKINEDTRKRANAAADKDIFFSPHEAKVYILSEYQKLGGNVYVLIETFLIFAEEEEWHSTLSKLLDHLS